MSDLDDEILALMGGGEDEESPQQLQSSTDNSAAEQSVPSDLIPSTPSPVEESSTKSPPSKKESSRRKRKIQRLEPSDSEGEGAKVEDEGEDSSGPVDEYDEDLYGNSQDRAYLNSLSQLEREQVLHDRAERRQQLLERREVRRMIREGERASQHKQRRSSERVPARSEARAKGREKLRRLRESRESAKKGLPSDHDSEDEFKMDLEEEGEEEEERDGGEYRRAGATASTPSKRDGAPGAWAQDAKAASIPVAREPEPTKEDFEPIRMTRTLLEKWINMPYFSKVATGAYLRNNIGPNANTGESVYRLVRIEEVYETTKPYPLGNTMTNKGAICSHGGARKKFTFSFASNGPLRTREVERFLKVCQADKEPVPTREELQRKKKDFDEAHNYTLSAEEVEEMIRLKRSLVGTSTVQARGELSRERDEAMEAGDMAKVEELTKTLKDLDERMAQSRLDPKMQALAEVNARNREQTLRQVREAEEEAVQEAKRRLILQSQGKDKEEGSKPRIMALPQDIVPGKGAKELARVGEGQSQILTATQYAQLMGDSTNFATTLVGIPKGTSSTIVSSMTSTL